MSKYALRAVEAALSLNKGNVPATRIRWYSLAEHLYSETLMKLLNPEAQEAEVFFFMLGSIEIVVPWLGTCSKRV
jgi:hypothetical protein